jgi:ATP/maltotriose-dependent transcriptional regulator MalT
VVSTTGSVPFVGRRAELDRLREAWDAVRAGAARIVGVEGDPGIGRTALVRRFVASTDPSLLVWVSGDQDETGLPWGVLSQLARAIPAIAPANGTWDAQADPVLVGQSLARELHDSKATILVVDDAHWADHPSLTAIRLAARRLFSDEVLLILIHQPPSASPEILDSRPKSGVAGPRLNPGLGEGWRRVFESERGVQIRVGGLGVEEVVLLAVATGHPGLSPGGAARLCEHTGGHPLQIRHLLDELPMHSIVFGDGPLPAPRGMAASVTALLARCRPATQEFVAAAAVIGRAFGVAHAGELAGHADTITTAEATAEALDAGLLEEVPGSNGRLLCFTSSVVRGMVYHDLGPVRRRELHGRAASRGGDGAIWHRISAAARPDGRLADDVECLARKHLNAGNVPAAAIYLSHALDLTPAGAARLPRLLATVEALLVAGNISAASEYEAELATDGAGSWSRYVLGYLLLLTGRQVEAKNQLDRALAAVRRDGGSAGDEPPDLEARIATLLALIGVLSVSYQDMIGYGERAVRAATEPWVSSFAWFTRSLGLAIAGRGSEALADLDQRRRDPEPSSLDVVVASGMIRLWTDDLPGARQDLTTAVSRATRGEALRIGQALGFLGEVEYRLGALAESVLHTGLAVGDATENDRIWDYAMLYALASYPLAAQGEWAQAQSHVDQATIWAQRVGTPAGLVYAAASRAALAHARGDPASLLTAAVDLEAFYPARESGTHLLGPLLADALSQLGRTDEATEALTAFLARLRSNDRVSTQLSIARVRAQIAAAEEDHEAALAACHHGLRLARSLAMPLEEARLELLTGKCQSAAGRRVAALRHLRAALHRFRVLGATAYVARTMRVARDERISMDVADAVFETLTRAERAVATLACQGLSNKEIAGQLVLSQKTIEFHLTRVFRKLDVATRAELREAVTSDRRGNGGLGNAGLGNDRLGKGAVASIDPSRVGPAND